MDLEEKVSITNSKETFLKEQEAKVYVLTKRMMKPKTNKWSVISIVMVYGLVFVLVYCAVRKLVALNWLVTILTMMICCLVFRSTCKYFLIKLVECYQHYAKEDTRRNCLCKPTCSEYAIAVLRKYPLEYALHKIRIRLFKTCTGGVYKIDLP